MNKSLQKLVDISQATSRIIVGLMSGTSLDGLDIALCKFSGSGADTSVNLLHFTTTDFSPEFKNELRSVSSKRIVDLQQVTVLNAFIGNYYADLILEALESWGFSASEVDIIASHGQTIYHAPQSIHKLPNYPNATLQIGDGDHIAVKTGIITLSDFRQKHIAAGGEGAPLAVYGDYLIFSDEIENRILLNIGGIANFTYLPAGFNFDQIFSTDVGPGNTILDQYVQQHFEGMFFDKDAELALSGRVDEGLLKRLLADPFFGLPFPKTTGPELFNLDYLDRAIKSNENEISQVNVLATLSEFTARVIADAIRKSIPAETPFVIYLSGGGMHNPLLKDRLAKYLNCKLKNTADLGINPDAKEAVLFALLANECLAAESFSYTSRPEMPAVAMGKVSLPF
ncbi:anhydro-N-acetylmuramic acid kinase [Pedobacter sp. BMA]|uniref:anhydro-N-acetylmuramic acid kinase n=1 Tax=Pedobacter sp. BMA TaxID=1663685 RepID=UPI00064A5F1F|nr:anhydro-N-acetylmuramic acid kinase [Pedobacter sp. BMA]KLT67566.1 anhydro-N-acetylmuramic acid kinase [Pedobacter sp. BMA]